MNTITYNTFLSKDYLAWSCFINIAAMFHRENFISTRESAQMIAKCLYDHVRIYEKYQIDKIYMCDSGAKAGAFTNSLGMRRNDTEPGK